LRIAVSVRLQMPSAAAACTIVRGSIIQLWRASCAIMGQTHPIV